jgi:ubiquitin C-terminal hydrolase
LISCLDVVEESKTEDRQTELFVSVRKGGAVTSLAGVLLEVEKLDSTNNNQYRSEKYGLQDAVKRHQVKRLPEVLFVNLKRYEVDGNQTKKLSHRF